MLNSAAPPKSLKAWFIYFPPSTDRTNLEATPFSMERLSYSRGPFRHLRFCSDCTGRIFPSEEALLMKLGLGLLTLLNVALAGFGLMMAMMSPMLFDSGGQQDQLLWAVFWTILAFPAVALVCVFVPWLFLWLKWWRMALFAAAIPAAWLIILFAVVFVRY
jgi:hypothetical protein